MNWVVHPDDLVVLNFMGDEFRTPQSQYRPTAQPHLTILYENRDLLVVNKPAGQKAHPNQPLETGTLMNDVAGYLQGTQSAAYMVHRIDQATSGALIVAKNPVVVPILDRLIAQGEIHRQYIAVVNGILSPLQGQMTWPIGRDPQDKRKRMVDGVNAQPAVTNYRVVGTKGNQSMVQLDLETGRTHQIRVHLAYSGHPIIGDPLYNEKPAPHLLLHGIRQQLILPFSGNLKQIYAPYPAYFPAGFGKIWS